MKRKSIYVDGFIKGKNNEIGSGLKENDTLTAKRKKIVQR